MTNVDKQKLKEHVLAFAQDMSHSLPIAVGEEPEEMKDAEEVLSLWLYCEGGGMFTPMFIGWCLAHGTIYSEVYYTDLTEALSTLLGRGNSTYIDAGDSNATH
jgi:hypothetical protein